MTGPLTRLAVGVATALIPPGQVRERYRTEFAAELAELSATQRVGHALSLVATAPALHRALVDSGAVDVPHSPLWCRVHLRHRWHTLSTDDGARFRRCPDCGLDHDGTMDSHMYGGYGITIHGITPG
jgi:hypothetical protein